MAVKILKKTAEKTKKATVQVSQTWGTMQQLVDQMGELKAKIAPLQEALTPLAKAYTETEAEMLALADSQLIPDQKTTVIGETYRAELGMKSNKTTLTSVEVAQKALENIEEGLFLLLASVGITDLKKYLDPTSLEMCTDTERSGKRSVKVEKKA